MKDLFRKLVVVACLMAAGAFSMWIWLRPELPRAATFTDGIEVRNARNLREDMRFALWDPARAVDDRLQTELVESDPFLDRDQGRLYFSTGPEGGDRDLWVAWREEDGAWRREALRGVNTAYREVAPCLHEGWLYFASDRPGGLGGLDLYRSRVSLNGFLTPEHLGQAVNSPADDSDPAHRPDADQLLFASNRDPVVGEADWDLYRARTDGARFSDAEPLERNTPYDERGPAFSPDGRVLAFTSNRPDGRGGLDLYRMVQELETWREAEPLRGPNTAFDETAPAFSDDGFTLLFATDRDSRPGGPRDLDLYQVRTRELHPVPATGFSLLDLTILLALLLVALLAFLAKRWSALDVIYKCLLLSMILHLLLLWLTRRVDIEVEPEEPKSQGTAYEVQLLANLLEEVLRESDREHGEEVPTPSASATVATLSRTENTLAHPDTPALSQEVLERSASESASAPGARPSEHAPTHSGPPTADPVETLTENYQRIAGEARALSVSGESVESTPTESAEAPARAQATSALNQEVAASSAPALARAEVTSGGVPRKQAEQTPTRSSSPQAQALQVPTDRTAAVAQADKPDLSLPAARSGDTGATSSDAVRTGSLSRATLQPGKTAAPTSRPSASTPLVRADGPRADATPERRTAPATRGGDQGMPTPTVATSQPADRVATERGTGLPARAELALSPASMSRNAKASSTGATPQRQTPSTDLPTPEREAGAQPVKSVARNTEATAGAPGRQRTELAQNHGGAAPPSPTFTEAERRLADAGPQAGTNGSSGTNGHDLAPRTLDVGPRSLAMPTRGLSAQKPSRASMRVNAPAMRHSVADAHPLKPADLPRRSPAKSDVPPRHDRLYERRTGEARQVALAEGGGSAETERAVLRGLRYLAGIQRQDGSFGDRRDGSEQEKYRDVRAGKTGLAALAFLGAGHTHQSDTEFSVAVNNALAWLLQEQDARSGHIGNSGGYGHGIATYAMAECHALTKDERLKRPLERAVAHILRHQLNVPNDPRRHGGWAYYYPEGRGRDQFARSSLSSWQVMALESAQAGGLKVPEEALRAARDYYRNCWDEPYGYFRYNQDPGWLNSNSGYRTLPASTPAALFVLQLLGDSDTPMMEGGAEFVTDRLPSGYRYRGDDAFVEDGVGNLYFWYYGSLALFLRGGPDWRQWNAAMKETLLAGQNRDGSWEPISTYGTRYAGDDRREKTYATAMSVLTLEVYYRYFTPQLMRHR